MRFGVLGPVEVSDNGRALRLGGQKQRALLAMLLLHANEVVSRDRLIDGLWGDRPPPSAGHTLDDYISRLRKALGDGRLARRPPGYVLAVDGDELDLAQFESLLHAGQEALASGDSASAEAQLREALALWRGAALADVMDEPFAQTERRQLEDKRVTAFEARIEADLALGRSSELVAELEALVREHPLRERLTGQLILALYRAGRQAEALAVARAVRHRLAEELGIEPGPSLQLLELAILEHDPSLDAPAVPTGTGAPPATRRLGKRRAWRLLAIAAVAVFAAAAGVLVPRLTRASHALRAVANSVGAIDTRAEALSAVVRTGGRPGGIAAGLGAVWETDTADDQLLEIDPLSRSVERVPVGHGPTAVATGDGEVWVMNQLDRTVSEINPRSLRQVGSFQVGGGADAAIFAHGALWVANGTDDSLSRISPRTGVVTTIPLAGTPVGLAAGPDELWVTIGSTGELVEVDTTSGRVTQAVPIGNGPAGVAVGAGAVWVANTPEGSVSRFDPASGSITKINVGRAPVGLAYGAGAVWVANSLGGTVARIDARSSSVRWVRVGGEPMSLAIAGGRLWTTVLAGLASHRGGTLRVVEGLPLLSVGSSLDPAVFAGLSQWQILSLTNDGLVTYRRVGGLAGSTLVPDLATALPAPTDGGRKYTFKLRAGIRYSSGALVRPEDFRRAIERVFELGDRYPESFYAGIVGASSCARAHTRCRLGRGIVADDGANTVTFNLTSPDPDFLYKLAFPMADAVPATTPDHEISPTRLPVTGPYVTQAISPAGPAKVGGHRLAYRTWVLVRNPRFRAWSPDAQPDGYPGRIVITQTAKPEAGVKELERGRVDVLASPPAGALEGLAVHYSNQLHSGPLAATFALAMNTHAAPFDRLAVRRALNFAIDRDRILGLAGGTLAGQPTCQILPPTLSGYEPYCPYTSRPNPSGSWTAPDLAQAERLVDQSGTRGMKVRVWTTPPDGTDPTTKIGRYVVSVLDRLGYRASLAVVADTSPHLADSRAQGQVGWFTWYQDYPGPDGFISPVLSCRSFVPHNRFNINIAEFCDPGIDAQLQRARTLQPADAGAASQIWRRIDHELTDRAAWLPLYNPRIATALSARVGNYQYHPFWQLLLDQLWVR